MNARGSFPETARVEREQLGQWLLDQYWDETLYLALANSRNILVELSDGRVVLHMMPTPSHQQVAGNLYAALRAYGRVGNRGRAYIAPMPVRLWLGKFCEPDVIYYRTEHLDRVGEQYGEVPDLIAEVVSPSTRAMDVGVKREEYAQAGIPEYWLLDPEARTVTVYILSGTKYRFAALYREGETVHSETLEGLEVRVSDLFE